VSDRLALKNSLRLRGFRLQLAEMKGRVIKSGIHHAAPVPAE